MEGESALIIVSGVSGGIVLRLLRLFRLLCCRAKNLADGNQLTLKVVAAELRSVGLLCRIITCFRVSPTFNDKYAILAEQISSRHEIIQSVDA